MKIVIISQNCYPWLGPRAHRTTELAKELARRGHKVIVYALLGNYDYTKIQNETGVIFKNLGNSRFGIGDNVGYCNRNIIFRLIKKIIGRYFEFPQIELIHMVGKALKQEDNIDYLITIAQPHPIHWGAEKYITNNKEKIKLWIADCGDPFMGNPFVKKPLYFKSIEKKWCKACNYISVPIEEAVNAYYPEFKDKIKIIPQGFDFSGVKLVEYRTNDIPTFAYSGIFYKDLRDPTLFLKYLSSLDFDFKFIVYTKSISFFKQYKEILKDKLEIRDYIPRDELLFELSKMDFLINIKNSSGVQQPSKIIDYAITKRPIIELSSEFKEQNVFEEFLKSNYLNRYNVESIEKYNIENVTNSFLNLYNK